MTETNPHQPTPPAPDADLGGRPGGAPEPPPGAWYAQPLNVVAVAVVLAVVVVAGILAVRWWQRDDPEAVKAVAVRYAQALAAGDVATLAQVSTGSDASLRLLEAQARKDAAYERLAKLAREKFGDDASVRLGGVRARDLGGNLVAAVEASPVEIAPSGQARVGGIALRKVDGQWRVDRDRQVPPGGDVGGPIAMLDALRGGYDTISAALSEGRVETAAEAREMLEEQTQSAVRAAVGRPVTARPTTATSTRPATVPATSPATTMSTTTRATAP